MSVTPNRATTVTLDPPANVLIEPVMAQQRSAAEMARGPQSAADGLWLAPRSGWIIAPAQRKIGDLHLSAGLQSSILGPSDGTTPAAWSQEPRFGQLDAPGIDYSVEASLTGDLFWVKEVASGEDWSSSSCRLEADATAFPGPDFSDQLIPVDRVFASIASHGPDEGLVVRIDVPGAKAEASAVIAAVLFCGPAGLASGGIGQYCLALSGDGDARLYESTGTGWTLAASHPWSARQRISGSAHFVHIHPTTKTLDPSLAGVILFEFESSKEAAPAASAAGAYLPPNGDIRQWAVPVASGGGAAQPSAWRLEVRRDLRLGWQLSRLTYPCQQVLVDDPLVLPYWPSSDAPLILAWFADVPAECSIAGELLDAATMTPLTPTGSVAGFPSYTVVPPERAFVPRFTLTSNAPGGAGSYGSAAPTLFGWRIQRDAVISASTLTPVTLKGVTEVGLTEELGATAHARVLIADAGKQAEPLLSRGARRLRIETAFDPIQPEVKAGLFEGEIGRPILRQQGRAAGSGLSASWPAAKWSEIELNAISIAERLREAVSPIRFDFGLDFNSIDANGHPLPFLASDALRTLFAVCGFGDDDLGFAPAAIRLFASADPQGLVIEPQARVGEVIVRWCRDFLNSRPYFDLNARVWRLLSLDGSGSAIASFVAEGPGPGKAAHSLASYPPGTAWIRRGSMQRWIEPPQANVIVGYGLASGSGETPCIIQQAAVNVAGLEVLGKSPDPNGLDFIERLRPILIAFPDQSTPEGLNWMVRRAFDRLAHGAVGRAWQSPLVLVPDEYQSGQMRPLRPGDAVSIEGETLWLKAVRPVWTKDEAQMCDYEGSSRPQ